jgi:hypothetical protein
VAAQVSVRLLSDEETMATVRAKFDGRAFVPCESVELPVGTTVEVFLPRPPRKLTTEEIQEWQEIQQELTTSEPHFPTVEEAMRYTRKRP